MSVYFVNVFCLLNIFLNKEYQLFFIVCHITKQKEMSSAYVQLNF